MKLLKLLHIHRWRYFRELHTIKGLRNRPDFKMSIPMRECKGCGKRQHHMMPTCGGMDYNWKDAKFGKNSNLKAQEN
jgi:hypothetical protein